MHLRLKKPLKLLSPPKYPQVLLLDLSWGCVTHVFQLSHLYWARISCSLVFLFSSPSSNTSCLWLAVIEFPGALIDLESLHFYNLILLCRRKFDSRSLPSQKKEREKKGRKKILFTHQQRSKIQTPKIIRIQLFIHSIGVHFISVSAQAFVATIWLNITYTAHYMH